MTNELKEIDMEDSDEEVAPDIDSCDAGNSLAVVEYVDEIYSFYRRSEVNLLETPVKIFLLLQSCVPTDMVC
jgi:hypothetical protein